MKYPKRDLLLCAIPAALLLGGCGSPGPSSGTPPPEVREQLRTASQAYSGASTEELMADAEAMSLASRLFRAHCAECHGANASGTRGVPDLTTGRFAYGSSIAAVRTTITHGRHSVMPGMGRDLGEVELGQVVAYVQSLSEATPLEDYEQRGRALYEAHCAECHGPRGRGLPEQGTPNLADDHWQHGGSMMNIRLAITRGVESQCPAQAGELTAAEIELLTAYVVGLASDGGTQAN